MKVNFEIELKDNSDSFAALLALITQASGGSVETPKKEKPKSVKPTNSDVDDELAGDDDGTSEEETPTETAAQKKKRLAAEKKAKAAAEKKAKAAAKKAAAEEMSGDETDALNDMDEDELRAELKKACKKYRATYGKAALVAILREHDGVKDDGSPSMSAVPEENLIDLIQELQAD